MILPYMSNGKKKRKERENKISCRLFYGSFNAGGKKMESWVMMLDPRAM